MSDASMPESGFEFTKSPTPTTVHGNWVMDKLQDFTMNREIEIKKQTMGADFEGAARLFIQPLLAGAAAHLGDNVKTLGLNETLNEIARTMPNTITLVGYYYLMKAYILGLDTSPDEPQSSEEMYIPGQKIEEALKKIDMSGKNRK